MIFVIIFRLTKLGGKATPRTHQANLPAAAVDRSSANASSPYPDEAAGGSEDRLPPPYVMPP